MEQLLEFMRSAGPEMLGALGFLCGILLIHWLTIGRERARDKRQEFNNAAKPLRAELIAIRDNPSVYNRGLTNAEVEFIQGYMSPLRSWRFRRAIARYKKCSQQHKQDEIGQPSYSDPAAVSACAQEILGHMKLR